MPRCVLSPVISYVLGANIFDIICGNFDEAEALSTAVHHSFYLTLPKTLGYEPRTVAGKHGEI